MLHLLERAWFLGTDSMDFIKVKWPGCIPRESSFAKDVVDKPVALGFGVVHVRVQSVVERRWRRKLDAVLRRSRSSRGCSAWGVFRHRDGSR